MSEIPYSSNNESDSNLLSQDDCNSVHQEHCGDYSETDQPKPKNNIKIKTL